MSRRQRLDIAGTNQAHAGAFGTQVTDDSGRPPAAQIVAEPVAIALPTAGPRPVSRASGLTTGRPVVIGIQAVPELHADVVRRAAEAGVTINDLVLAAVQQHLPESGHAAARLVIAERQITPGRLGAKTSLRLPGDLAARLRVLTAEAERLLASADAGRQFTNMSILIAALVRQGLPADAEQTGALVAAYKADRLAHVAQALG